jgi:glycosyltransferase involved in cell wall biosynthesis
VLLAAELFSQDTHIPVVIVSGHTYYAHEDEILKAFGKARIAVGLSISDGLPRSLLEAMVMGAYPIQSDTACLNGWIEDGKNGTLVPPEDPEIVARAIRVALTSDALVNNAAKKNFKIARERLDDAVISPMVVKMYNDILQETL